jgi:hypothetical protein
MSFAKNTSIGLLPCLDLMNNMSNPLLHIEVSFVHGLFMPLLCLMATMTFFYLQTKRKYVRSERMRIKLEAENREMLLERQKFQQDSEKLKQLTILEGLHQIEKKELITETVRKTRQRIPVDLPVEADERDKIIHALKKSGAAHQWDEFELRFLQVHLDFNKKIHALSPKLSSSERRLCYFLLVDMSTKEIANITGQTNRAVELGRIRLRKKLGLTNTETSLFDFLSNM